MFIHPTRSEESAPPCCSSDCPLDLKIIVTEEHMLIQFKPGLSVREVPHGDLILCYDFTGETVMAKVPRGTMITLRELFERCSLKISPDQLLNFELHSI